MIYQKEISLSGFRRGFHLITHIIEKQIDEFPEKGILNLLIKHTSAALIINENADSSVRTDFNNFVNKMVPENEPYFVHTLEGEDDMPAHIKSSLFGQSLTIPITDYRLNLGTWQGIYLCEFRNHRGNRKVVLTVYS